MATTTGPDLSAGQAAIEAMMDDTCLITRNTGSVDDATLDQNTGLLSDPGLGTPVYEGACLLKAPSGLVNRPQEEGGQVYTQGTYELRLPLSYLASNADAEPEIGDTVVITSSRRDPAAVDYDFRVLDVTRKTMAIARALTLERRG